MRDFLGFVSEARQIIECLDLTILPGDIPLPACLVDIVEPSIAPLKFSPGPQEGYYTIYTDPQRTTDFEFRREEENPVEEEEWGNENWGNDEPSREEPTEEGVQMEEEWGNDGEAVAEEAPHEEVETEGVVEEEVPADRQEVNREEEVPQQREEVEREELEGDESARGRERGRGRGRGRGRSSGEGSSSAANVEGSRRKRKSGEDVGEEGKRAKSLLTDFFSSLSKRNEDEQFIK